MTLAQYTLDHPIFAGRTGRGITVAVIDSGIHAANPHVNAVRAALTITEEGELDGAVDRLGHGTAVAAAILEKAPGIELIAVRVFDRTLATSATVLARALARAADHGARLINLSLGTPNHDRAAALRAAVEHAATRGAIIVSAREGNGTLLLPGCLPNVAGVALDPACPRDALRLVVQGDGTLTFAASGLPRPIPGVPAERNVHGISFAVANTCGFLARLLEERPELYRLDEVARALGSR